jgi:hypothetical protein
MRVPHLLRTRPLDLAGAGVLAPHQPGVGQEVADLGEAGDGVDLVQQGQPEDRPDARDRPQEPSRSVSAGS